MRSFLALGAFVALACVSQEAHAIVSGDPSAVEGVGLVLFSNNTVCSGFLASPNVVVTAAFCFNDGKTPVAFYTGPGTAVADAGSVTSAADLVKHDIKVYARHPQAAPQAAETGAPAYTAKNDVAYVVLTTKAKEKPLAYGGPATGACSSHGYGRNGAVSKAGTIGARRGGAVSVEGVVSGSMAIQVVAGHIGNSGDFGGPLICADNVAGIFSAYHSDAQSIIDVGAYQPVSGTIKTFIDDAVTSNPPPVDATVDAGADADTTPDAAADSAPPSESTPAPDATEMPPATAPRANDGTTLDAGSDGGCSTGGGRAGGWLLGLVAVAALRKRVLRHKMR